MILTVKGYCTFFSLQISAGASNPRLSDTIEYPTLLRTVSSDAAVVDGIIAMMNHYDWSRIACITQQEFIFTAVCIIFEVFFSLLRQYSVNIGLICFIHHRHILSSVKQ